MDSREDLIKEVHSHPYVVSKEKIIQAFRIIYDALIVKEQIINGYDKYLSEHTCQQSNLKAKS